MVFWTGRCLSIYDACYQSEDCVSHKIISVYLTASIKHFQHTPTQLEYVSFSHIYSSSAPLPGLKDMFHVEHDDILSLSACLPVCLSVHACLLACLSACLPACLTVYLSSCLSVCPSVCLLVCQSSCLLVWFNCSRSKIMTHYLFVFACLFFPVPSLRR